MNRYKKLLQNTGLITLGTFGSKLLPFLLMRLYTAALSDGDYNTADLVTQTAKLLIPFAARSRLISSPARIRSGLSHLLSAT